LNTHPNTPTHPPTHTHTQTDRMKFCGKNSACVTQDGALKPFVGDWEPFCRAGSYLRLNRMLYHSTLAGSRVIKKKRRRGKIRTVGAIVRGIGAIVQDSGFTV